MKRELGLWRWYLCQGVLYKKGDSAGEAQWRRSRWSGHTYEGYRVVAKWDAVVVVARSGARCGCFGATFEPEEPNLRGTYIIYAYCFSRFNPFFHSYEVPGGR